MSVTLVSLATTTAASSHPASVSRSAGNNGPVSAAMASSSLNGPRLCCGPGPYQALV